MTRAEEINALVEERDFPRAQALAMEWVRESPAAVAPWTTLALTLKLQRSYGAAANAAQTATLLAPNEPGLWMDLGMIHYLGGNFDGAAESFGKAVATGEELNVSYYEEEAVLCQSISLLKANRVEEANSVLVKLDSGEVEMWLDKHFTAAEVRNEIERRMPPSIAKGRADREHESKDH